MSMSRSVSEVLKWAVLNSSSSEEGEAEESAWASVSLGSKAEELSLCARDMRRRRRFRRCSCGSWFAFSVSS